MECEKERCATREEKWYLFKYALDNANKRNASDYADYETYYDRVGTAYRKLLGKWEQCLRGKNV